jgi:hypothetical protein
MVFNEMFLESFTNFMRTTSFSRFFFFFNFPQIFVSESIEVNLQELLSFFFLLIELLLQFTRHEIKTPLIAVMSLRKIAEKVLINHN